MASVGDIRAGGAFVEIGATDSKLVAALYKSAARIKQFGENVRRVGLQAAGTGGAILTPLAAASTGYAEHGAAIERASQKTGIGVEALSGIQYAAKQSGVDIDALTGSVFRMDKTLQQAARGSKEAKDALGAVGVTIGDLNNLSQEDRVKKLADAISNISDPAVQAGTAMKIFGRGAGDILPFLQLGSKGISDYQKEAEKLGLTWSGQDAAAALAFSQSLDTLWEVTKRLTDYVGSAVAPMFKKLADFTTNLIVPTMKWVQAHGRLLGTLALVSGGVVALGTGLVVAGTVIANVGIVLGTVAAGFGVLAATVSTVLTPIGLVGAGLLAAVEHFYGLSNAASDVGGFIKGVFKQIYDAISFVFHNTSNLGDAWKAAQTELGFVVLGAWLTVKGKLMDAWIGFKGFMGNLWDDVTKDAIWATGQLGTGILSVMHKIVSTVFGLLKTVKDEIRAIGEDFAGDQAEMRAVNKYINRKIDPKSAQEFAADEYAGLHPSNPNGDPKAVAARAAQIQRDYGGKSFSGYDFRSQLEQFGKQASDVASQAASKINDQQYGAGSAFTDEAQRAKELAELQDEVDKQASYVKKLSSSSPATDAERAKNDAAIAAAKAEEAAARKKYEEAQHAQYAAGGKQSLAGQFEHLFDPIAALIKRTAEGPAGNASDSTYNVKQRSIGAFNVSGQGLAAEIFGGGRSDDAKKTAENTKAMLDALQEAPSEFVKAFRPVLQGLGPVFT